MTLSTRSQEQTLPKMTKGMSEVVRSSLNLLRPPPTLTISKWADKFRVLSPEGSSEAGKFETSRAQFQKEIIASITHTKERL